MQQKAFKSDIPKIPGKVQPEQTGDKPFARIEYCDQKNIGREPVYDPKVPAAYVGVHTDQPYRE